MLGFWISRVAQDLPILVNATGSAYASGCNYGSVMNKSGFWICQVSPYVSIVQRSEYAWIWLNNAWINCLDHSDYGRVLNMSPVLNMPGLGIWQGCEYARVTKSAEYA